MKQSEILGNLEQALKKQESERKQEIENLTQNLMNEVKQSFTEELNTVPNNLVKVIRRKTLWNVIQIAITAILLITSLSMAIWSWKTKQEINQNKEALTSTQLELESLQSEIQTLKKSEEKLLKISDYIPLTSLVWDEDEENIYIASKQKGMNLQLKENSEYQTIITIPKTAKQQE